MENAFSPRVTCVCFSTVIKVCINCLGSFLLRFNLNLVLFVFCFCFFKFCTKIA